MIAEVCLGTVGAVFAFAAARKVSVSAEFRAAVASWALLPPRSRRIVSRLVPLAELSLAGVAVIALAGSPRAVPWALGLSAGMLIAFALAQAMMAARGRDALCGCFSASGRIGRASIARAIVVAIIPVAGLVSLVV